MASGHGVPKPRMEEHPGRDVHRERFVSEMSDKWSFDISNMSEEEFHAENAYRRDQALGYR